MDAPFHWLDDATTKITATTTSANAQLKRMPTGRTQIRIFNAGSTLAFVRKGSDSSVSASASNPDLPVAAGAVEVLTLHNAEARSITHIAAVFASGSGDVYVTVGQGF